MNQSLACCRLSQTDDLSDCLKIRHEVFVIGQNVPPDLEVDGKDNECWHYLAEQNGKPVATARVCFPDKNTAKIQRVAVLDECQGKGVGKALMLYILADLKNHASKAKLDSQTHAIPFYAKLGFKKIGKEFMDAGIPHYTMTLDIKP